MDPRTIGCGLPSCDTSGSSPSNTYSYNLQQFARFQAISLNDTHNHTPNHLYGGVDVSFPTDENVPAVAVFVILDTQREKIVNQYYQHFDLQVKYPVSLPFWPFGRLSLYSDWWGSKSNNYRFSTRRHSG
jgi:hypothetical protein